jgi:uncharacterized membrane protein
MRLPRIILLCLVGIFVAQIGYYYLNLPETVASHFDAAGNPNGWMSKSTFVIFELFLLLFVGGQFVFVPRMIEKMPNSMINLPNKDYWLANDRRAETFGIIRNYFEWFSVALLILFIAINQLVFRANINHENLSDKQAWLIIGAFLAFVFVWLISLVRKFRNPR